MAAMPDLSKLTTPLWEDYFLHFQEHVVMEPKYHYKISYIGTSCPPLETEHGWHSFIR